MAALAPNQKHNQHAFARRKLMRVSGVALLVMAGLWAAQANQVARAVPVAPALSAAVSSLDLAQGQAGYAGRCRRCIPAQGKHES